MGHYQKRGSKDCKELLLELRLSQSELERIVREGLQGLALEIGVEVAQALLEDEIEQRVGVRRRRDPKRTTYRHGRQRGWISLGGAKAPIDRPRMRALSGGERDLKLYRRMQQGCEEAVTGRLIRGVSCRNYAAVIAAIRTGYGISASAVSRSFVAASEARIQQLAERRYEGVRFAAIFIDGVCFARETLVVALGVTEQGRKIVLAIKHGATENAGVCTDLLEELRDRGVNLSDRLLFVLDGSKALRAAVDRVCGKQAEIQRCQVHKLRNIKSYVPDRFWPDVRTAIQKAYAETSYVKAKRILNQTARWLDRINPHAGASLREGLDETLTVTRLGLTGRLRATFATTNIVEGLFSRVRTITGRVKRWRPGSMRQRWCATAALEAEAKFRAVRGCSDIARLLDSLGRQTTKLRTVA